MVLKIYRLTYVYNHNYLKLLMNYFKNWFIFFLTNLFFWARVRVFTVYEGHVDGDKEVP